MGAPSKIDTNKIETSHKPLTIGMFDSGVGGLTVLKELLRVMPHESYVYFGDTARYPYGSKSPQTISRYSVENSIFLLEQNCQLIAIPCHTATALGMQRLKNTFSVPVLGVIEPAVEKVIQTTKTKRIGVIATKATILSGTYQREISARMEDAQVIACPCPLFVSLVEERISSREIVRLIVKEYLAPLKKKKVDTLLLGSTHYPHLMQVIQEEMGPEVQIVNPALAFAEKIAEQKRLMDFVPHEETFSHPRFFVSDDPKRFKAIGEAFLGIAMKDVQKVSFS